MIADLNKVKDKVSYILSKYPETRDDDKLLWIAYLCMFHSLNKLLGTKAYEIFKCVLMDSDTPTMESVRRVRQKYQEEGMFVGKKRAKRMEEAQNVKDWAVYNK